MTKRKVWTWGIVALTGTTLFIFVIYPRIHSSRLDALEPYMKPGVAFDEIRQVAEDHDIPLEPDAREPAAGDTRFTVQLDGSMRGSTLQLTFTTGFGLVSAYVFDRDGKAIKQWFCVLR
jgi:hypothetical protein